MYETNRTQKDRPYSRRIAVPAFRFKRAGAAHENLNPPPFTSDEPRTPRSFWRALGRLVRALVNTLFMLALVVSLLALIAAFAYQLVTNPEAMAAKAHEIIGAMQSFFTSLVGS